MNKGRKGKGRPSIWTDELIEQLLKLWQQGLSATDIARQLGHGLSRNAVIGKIHRLRAAGKVPPRREGDASAATRKSQPTRRSERKSPQAAAPGATAGNKALAVQLAPAAAPAPATQPRVKVVAMEEGLVKDIMDLKHHSCRWPIGTPGEEGFSYCGRRAADGGPYCEHHATIAYTSSTGTAQKRAAG